MHRSCSLMQVNPVRTKFAQMAESVISYFEDKKPLRLYKKRYEYNEDTASIDAIIDKDNFQEFTGVLFSINPDSIVSINESNLGDMTCLYTLYTSAQLDFEISDRISEGDLDNFHFEIISIDGSVGYLTLTLKGVGKYA
ncbi:uncharacterized conserved protein (plasmid) [Borrelia duttonii Ly]|uniref:Uncharacterized conserved protein n=2 Tax=Borrelia duttonii TaxID=40834 RepID=B5RNX3_BORDL|nr:uncharacterized conserved protein [Borrelia duttonii Ly]